MNSAFETSLHDHLKASGIARITGGESASWRDFSPRGVMLYLLSQELPGKLDPASCDALTRGFGRSHHEMDERPGKELAERAASDLERIVADVYLGLMKAGRANRAAIETPYPQAREAGWDAEKSFSQMAVGALSRLITLLAEEGERESACS